MPSGRLNKTLSMPGYSFSSSPAATSFDSTSNYEVTVPALVAAQTAGSLTTRTDADTGVVTLSTGHGIATSDTVDVYWTESGVAKNRYGMTATVSGDAVTVDGGSGDDLPAQDETIDAVVKQTEVNPLNLDGDNAQLVAVVYKNAADTGAKGHVDFQDSGSASIAEHDLVHVAGSGGLDNVTEIANGDTNVYTGNPITKGFVSHDSTSAGTLYVLAGIDSTP